MKISEALTFSKNALQQNNIISWSLDALVLLAYATSFSKEKIIFNPDLELTQNQCANFLQAVARRQAREPVSHIIGKREFYGHDFFVSADVLDPRPDSESLIELVLEKFPNKNQELKILEIGVGSGCLVIMLLKNFANMSAIGLDISAKALRVAQKNSLEHQVDKNLQLLESNLFSTISAEKKFDLIISNPPYIPAQEIENLAAEVRLFEPRTALDGGADGLDFYRRIAAQAASFLKPRGLVFLEVGHDQRKMVEKIFAENKFILIAVKHDLSGFERALCFQEN